jgi:hypothetical protein
MRNSSSLKKNLTEDGKKLINSKIIFLFHEAHEKLKPFDRKFIASLMQQFKKRPALSIKQLNKLDEIYERVAAAYSSENNLDYDPFDMDIIKSILRR